MDARDYLQEWYEHCVYVNGQLEAGDKGTTHIQYFISLKKK